MASVDWTGLRVQDKAPRLDSAPQTVKILGEPHPLPQTPAGSQGPAKLLQEIAWCEEMKERTG